MIACKYCIMMKGLHIEGGEGRSIKDNEKIAFENEENYFNHLEMEHDLVVRREGETEEEARKRVEKKQKEEFGFVRIGSDKCRCPSCMRERRGK